MKKTGITFGLIAGLIMASGFFLTIPSDGSIDFSKGELIGSIVMIVAMSLIYFAIRRYKKFFPGQAFTFGHGFRIGLIVTLTATAVYVISWMIFYEIRGDAFTESYTEYYLEQIDNSDSPAEEKKIEKENFSKGVESYASNPWIRIFYTFMEIFPIGFLVTVVCAILLRKRTTSGVF